MTGSKPHANATFTHRVDHERKRHHEQRSQPEPAVCEVCNAYYSHRRWQFAKPANEPDKPHFWKEVHRTVCPACRQEAHGEARGFLYASGNFVATHHGDIARLLFNVADRASEDDPLARILSFESLDRDTITVTTTTEHLAQRLGHALDNSYQGEVHFRFAHEDKLARVTWHRD